MKTKKTTIHDIAKVLDITAATVSRALNDNARISSGTKKRVRETAKKLNYQPNVIAASLRSGKSNTIGVILPIINREFFSSVLRGVEEIADSYGYRIIISQSQEKYLSEIAIVNTLLNAQVDGILVSVGLNSTDFSHYQKVIKKGVPMVQFDRTNQEIPSDQVVINDFLGGFMATEHLIEQGCRNIAHFTSIKKVKIYKERFRGYREALKKYNIPYDKSLICTSNIQLEDGKNCTEKLLRTKKKFDAIFAASDYAAVGALQVLRQNHIKIPQQVAIVGFSNELFASFTEPPLSTVNQFPIEMGRRAAEQLFSLINSNKRKTNVKKEILRPELIVRGSSTRKRTPDI